MRNPGLYPLDTSTTLRIEADDFFHSILSTSPEKPNTAHICEQVRAIFGKNVTLGSWLSTGLGWIARVTSQSVISSQRA